jgi:ABC-type multidrug transport system fused ATPase/permease subunit
VIARWLRPLFRPFIRNVDAPALYESFFIAAVTSFLGIRGFLQLAGYPQIGSNGLHIAHVLFGGALMLVAMLLQIGFIDRPTQEASAVIGGLGFGTFIDELGKFVTSDNDYFYQPAVALIYAVFVVAFLVARTFVGRRRLGQREALANAIRLLAVESDGAIEREDRARIVRLLEKARPDSERTKLARQYLAALKPEREELSAFDAIRRRVADAYEAFMATPWADRALTIGVIAYAVIAVIGVGLVGFLTGQRATVAGDFATVTQFASTIAGALLIALGVVRLPTSRLAAYHWFQRGILVWILITQVFVFYSSQFAGLSGLVGDLVAYGSLRYAIEREIAAGRG